MSTSTAVSSNASNDAGSWSRYFATRPANESMCFDQESYITRLQLLSTRLFVKSTSLEILESRNNGDAAAKLIVEDDESLTTRLENSPNPALRIFSIHQTFSLSPFNITEPCISRLFMHHALPPGLLDIICGFGDKVATADEGCASGTYSDFESDRHDIFYQFQYVERNNRTFGDPWSVRQTGVYHRFETVAQPSSKHDKGKETIAESNTENLWMLLHPMPNSRAQTRLAAALEGLTAEELAEDPLRLHVLILSSYVDNWRWYLHDVKRRYTRFQDKLMTAELRNDRVLNFEMLQDLRHLQSKFIPIPTMIDSLLSTLESIQRMNKKLQSIQRRNNRSSEAVTASANSATTHITASNTASEALTGDATTATPTQESSAEAGASTVPPTAAASTSTAPPTTPALAETSYHLTSLVSRLKAYRSSAEMHQKHIENMTKFLADTLNIKNQEIAAESNKALVKLTHDTVDDSSTVKTITFITLVYLPASFISGLFGMNLVKFGDDWNFNVSNQWWLYLPAVAIVMFITWCFWKASVTFQKRKKREREAEEEEAEREKMGEV